MRATRWICWGLALAAAVSPAAALPRFVECDLADPSECSNNTDGQQLTITFLFTEPPVIFPDHECIPDCLVGEDPNVEGYDLTNMCIWGAENADPDEDRIAYTFGFETLNSGPGDLNWSICRECTPLFAMNLYRYTPHTVDPNESIEPDRFEQIGQSWLKRGTSAEAFCPSQCPGGCAPGVNCPDYCEAGWPYLAAGCRDLYPATVQGNSPRTLTPRSDVNPFTGDNSFGTFPTAAGVDEFDKGRINVLRKDLLPDSEYYTEYLAVHVDDAPSDGDTSDNFMYRQVRFQALANNGPVPLGNCATPPCPCCTLGQNVAGVTLPTCDLEAGTDVFAGNLEHGQPAIYEWVTAGRATLATADGGICDGKFHVGYKVTDLGGGQWHYEYAIFNEGSERAARAFTVPISATATITNIDFHDVDYHSGEPFDGTDWATTQTSSSLTWETADYETNQNANALRWGTLYNFRFDADRPPQKKTVSARLEYFKPDQPPCDAKDVTVQVEGP